MIIKGASHSGKGLGAYLMQDKNDRAEVLGIRGDISRDLSETLDDWRSDALTTRCSKPLYHAQINPDRALSREEWEKAVEIFEKEMGLENQPRAVVLHEFKGREHYHLVYSRIDENGKAISDSWNYLHHEKAAREIERELGLERTQGAFIDREGERPERTHSREEIQQGERLNLDPKAIKAEVSALYQQAGGNGREFVDALKAEGYDLAQGDRRAYVILDQAGGVHSLSRMAGAKVAALRETLQEYPLQGLPTVEAAREMQQERQQAEPVRSAEQAQQPDPLANRPKPEGERLQRMTGRYDPLNAEHEKAQAAPASEEKAALPTLEERIKQYNEGHQQRQERGQGQGLDRGRERER